MPGDQYEEHDFNYVRLTISVGDDWQSVGCIRLLPLRRKCCGGTQGAIKTSVSRKKLHRLANVTLRGPWKTVITNNMCLISVGVIIQIHLLAMCME